MRLLPDRVAGRRKSGFLRGGDHLPHSARQWKALAEQPVGVNPCRSIFAARAIKASCGHVHPYLTAPKGEATR